MLRRDDEKGRSMVEMMGYMAVAISLVASVGHLVAKAFDEYKYSKAYIQLSDLVGSIVRASAIDADYQEVVKMVNGESIEASKNKEGQKLIPGSYRRIGNTLYHAFGGKVTISLPPVDGGINLGEAINEAEDETAHSDKFAVTFEGLTRKQCIEMALKDWNNNKNIDLYAIIINSAHYWYWPAYTVFTEVEGVVVDNTLPVTRVAVTGTGDDDEGQCDREINNSIMWIFN